MGALPPHFPRISRSPAPSGRCSLVLRCNLTCCCPIALMLAQAGLEFSVSRRKQLASPLHPIILLAELQFRPVDLL